MEHVLRQAVPFRGRDGLPYELTPLTEKAATCDIEALAAMHADIPYVGDNLDTILTLSGPGNIEYRDKFKLSFAVKHRSDVVAFLLAWVRRPSEHHPMESIYIHRLAVAQSHRRNGVATNMIVLACEIFFRAVPALLTTSVQTNDESSNQHVISLYRRLGFTPYNHVEYSNKLDILLELTRNAWLARTDLAPLQLLNSPLPIDVHAVAMPLRRAGDQAPTVYLATGSPAKRAQYTLLFRQQGLVPLLLPDKTALPEPQIDGSGQEAETELVSFPLRYAARFREQRNRYPVFVEDTMLFIEHFNTEYDNEKLLPGPDTKRWWAALGIDGILQMMRGSHRRRAQYVCQIGLHYGTSKYRNFRFELNGEITLTSRQSELAVNNFPRTNATFFHKIFKPNESANTLAEMAPAEFYRFDYRRHCLVEAADFLKTIRVNFEGGTAPLFELP